MYTYLIIDDEELIRKGIIKKLDSLATQITCIGEAWNGLFGIELIKKSIPDFIILDMQMPTMDGMTLLPYLREHYPAIPLIVVSGYRNFDYIKQAISANAVEYILKPFSRETIQNCVLQIINHLEEREQIENQIIISAKEKEQAHYNYDIQLLYNLILGYHVSDTNLTSKRLNFINSTYSLILLTLHFENTSDDTLIQEWITEHGFGDLALYLSEPETTHLGFIVLFLPQHSSLSGNQLVNQILDALLPFVQKQNMIPVVGVSNVHKSLSWLNTAYQETSSALNQQLVSKPHKSRYFYSNVVEPKQIEWNLLDEFLFRIESGAEDAVRTLTHSLFKYYKELSDCTLADIKYHCYQLSSRCRTLLNQYLNISNLPEHSGSMQNVVNHIFTVENLEFYYLQFFLNITSMISPKSVYAIDDTIEKIQIYMQHNLHKNLTQEYVSVLFYINRSYLSTLFRARTGKKFIDYLNELRISHAQDLLVNSDRKMYQIAKSVGYDNVKYFFRVFKKHTNLTPEQYRKQHTSKASYNIKNAD